MKALAICALLLLVLLLSVRHHRDHCAQFEGFDSWGNEEDFIWSFPETRQPHVRYCLDKLAKRRGLHE